jgi:hypothetical protein
MLTTVYTDAHAAISNQLDTYSALLFAASCKKVRATILPLINNRSDMLHKTVAYSIINEFLTRFGSRYVCELQTNMITKYEIVVKNAARFPRQFVHENDIFTGGMRLLSVHFCLDEGYVEVGVFVNKSTYAVSFKSLGWHKFYPTSPTEGTVHVDGVPRVYSNGLMQAMQEIGSM